MILRCLLLCKWDTQEEIVLNTSSERVCTLILYFYISHRFGACGEAHRAVQCVGWEWVFMFTTGATQHPSSFPCHNFGSHSTLACSPTELPRIQQCYRMNLELLFVRSCCFITAVRLMSNLFFARKFIFFFSFCKMGSGKGMEGGS